MNKKICALLITFLYCHTPLFSKIPIVYSEQYTIDLAQILNDDALFDLGDVFAPSPERIKYALPINPERYQKIFDLLQQKTTITPHDIYQPAHPIFFEDLRLVHTEQYLLSLNDGKVLDDILHVPFLRRLFPQQIKFVLSPFQFMTQGTIDACFLALEYGWAINIGGGFHHAHADHGEGFCIYADIPIAIHKVLDTVLPQKPDFTIMIIDLDAHQGNGNVSLLQDNRHVVFFDMYNPMEQPYDRILAESINYNLYCLTGTTDQDYLQMLRENLPRALEVTKPNLIIFNAGSDILQYDPLGRMNVLPDGLWTRDLFVFQCAQERNIPIAMVLSGGYTNQSIDIVATSIKNIIEYKNPKQKLRMKKKKRACGCCTIL